MPREPALIIRPLTPARWTALAKLFGPAGAVGGCWCMYWRLPATAFARHTGADNRAALQERVKAGDVPGVLAYRGGEPVGWCGVGPRTEFARLMRSPHLRLPAPEPVWSIVCVFVHAEQRGAQRDEGGAPRVGQAIARALVAGAVAYAARHGARSVEAYPYRDRVATRYKGGLPAGMGRPGFSGSAALYQAAGFQLAGLVPAPAGGPRRVIMRCAVPEAAKEAR